MKCKQTQKRGFSFIEVMVVLIIIAILSSIVVIQVVDEPDQAKVTACKVSIKAIDNGLKMYRARHGNYPTLAQGLNALIQPPVIEPIPQNYPPEGYLNAQSELLDPWDNPYIYLVPGRQNEAYEILSYGADGEPGGEGYDADISNRQF